MSSVYSNYVKRMRMCANGNCKRCTYQYEGLVNTEECKEDLLYDAAGQLEDADKCNARLLKKCKEMEQRIAELEAQISEHDAANVIILPCNIGDKIYYCRFDKDGDGWITPMIVCGIHVTKFRTKEKDGEQYLVCELPWFSRSVHVPLKELGKTLFLTEEEAKRCISNA